MTHQKRFYRVFKGKKGLPYYSINKNMMLEFIVTQKRNSISTLAIVVWNEFKLEIDLNHAYKLGKNPKRGRNCKWVDGLISKGIGDKEKKMVDVFIAHARDSK